MRRRECAQKRPACAWQRRGVELRVCVGGGVVWVGEDERRRELGMMTCHICSGVCEAWLRVVKCEWASGVL